MYKILVSLGSNIYSKQNIDKARRMLIHYFPDIVFTPSVIIIENGENNSLPFRNVLGIFNSELPSEEIIQKLKLIEYAMGRQPRDKESGKVIIDIDLLQYGDQILRPEDFEKEYVQALLKEINAEAVE
ncbi:MAG: 2-amino-4-hydroxy-6-hydroxymethyldihydropteridine diphosphokinase [Bacteroidia bacterium]|nr:2-amino-4-hydroxy-6-hydroxymethyldihydropteridine diphosphokinase [Bacteroidia bacterium]